jgi:hypothetical protein
MRGRIVKGALGAIIGGAAVGGAQVLASHHRRPRVLGIPIPDGLNPRHGGAKKLTQAIDPKKLTQAIDPKKLSHSIDAKKLADNLDVKDVMRKIGDAAEQIEARSEDVRMLSAQAKRLTRKLS